MSRDLFEEALRDVDEVLPRNRDVNRENVEFALSLLLSCEGKGDKYFEEIPIPSESDTALMICGILSRPEIPWSEQARKLRVRGVFEYLFIRSYHNYDEVSEFMKRMIKTSTKPAERKMYLNLLSIMESFIMDGSFPKKFAQEIIFPEYQDQILSSLHILGDGESGRGLALVMRCAKMEGLVRNIGYPVICSEFPQADKSSYNKYLHDESAYSKAEIQSMVQTLRRRICYSVSPEDGTLVFKDTPFTRKNIMHLLRRYLMGLFRSE